MLLTSIPPVLQWLCRIIGVTGWWLAHLLFAIASVVGMAGYIGVVRPVADASLSAVVAVYLSGTLWILGTGYRYIRRRRTPASIKSDRSHSESTEVVVRCTSQISVFPGCYFYVYFSRRYKFGSLHFDIFVHSLPLMLAWGPEAGDGSSKEELMTFILSHGSRTSKFVPHSGQEILLDGPYGQDINAAACTTMVLAASGPGIVGLLSFASHQVGRYKHMSSRKEKRRVDLLWVLDDVCQQDLVGNKLRELQNMDQDSVRSSSPGYYIC
jgi:predicted ferric reductase